MGETALPTPDALALATSEALISQIKQRIGESGGSISFADYMHMVLYQPGLGYYMAGAQKFGASGDFITSPEVSTLFGFCIANQCAQIFEQTSPRIVELGAGSGKLAASIIGKLGSIPEFQYDILEPGAELQQRQQAYLQSVLSPESFVKVRWHSVMPQNIDGIILANEVMDALPVEQFRIHDSSVMQLMVSVQGNDFYQNLVPAPTEIAQQVRTIENDIAYELPHGYQSELSMQLPAWIGTLADSLKRGVVLLCDYGYPRREYYFPERSAGTLSCFYQHHTHRDVFFHPGVQDITAHVDFTRVVESGCGAGMELLGYTTQASFLLDNDLLNIAEPLLQTCQTDAQRLTLAAQIKTLSLPGEMGERFQFMAFGKAYGIEGAANRAEPLVLAGFRSQDLSHRL